MERPYIGNMAVKIPRICMIEFCIKSQKSTSDVEPVVFDASRPACIIGMNERIVTANMIAVRVEEAYERAGPSLSFIRPKPGILTFCLRSG